MTLHPFAINQNTKVADTERIMQEKKVTLLCVENTNGRIIGYVHIHDFG